MFFLPFFAPDLFPPEDLLAEDFFKEPPLDFFAEDDLPAEAFFEEPPPDFLAAEDLPLLPPFLDFSA